MSFKDWFSTLRSPQTSAEHEHVDGLPPKELILYKFDSCPFCVRVMRVIDAHELPVSYRDTRQNSEYRQELVKLTGRTQVPCLLIDGQPMLESKDIIRYLQKVFKLK